MMCSEDAADTSRGSIREDQSFGRVVPGAGGGLSRRRGSRREGGDVAWDAE